MKEQIKAFFADENKRKNFIFIISLIAALGIIFALATLFPREDPAIEEKKQYKTYSYSYFDTVSTIIGYADSTEEFGEITTGALALLGEYHKLFDIYNEYEGINNICTVNKLIDGEHIPVKVDQRIIDMLLYAKETYTLTQGNLNVAMGSVLSIWHDYRTAGIDLPSEAVLPPMELLTEAAEHTDINDLVIDEENGTVYLADPKMTLDVGAIAKGYAVEMVARQLEESGVTGFVLNIGGNIRAVGAKPDGSKWRTGIESPSGDGYAEYVELAEETIVTSGSYQRYYLVQGKKYHHIIDKDTLMPATGFLSVSVICDDSGLGDALSTALFCMSLEDGMSLINSMDNAEAMWITEDETVHYSDNFSRYEY